MRLLVVLCGLALAYSTETTAPPPTVDDVASTAGPARSDQTGGKSSETAAPPKLAKAPKGAKARKAQKAKADGVSDAWVEEAVEDALDNEIMPGTTGEPEPGREDALRAFFQAHPEYRDAERRAPLWEHACGLGGTEEAHEYITNPPPKAPVEVEVEGDDWRVFVAHAAGHCTSDDWGWYTAEATESAQAFGAVTAYGNADTDALVIRSKGKELLRMPLSGKGYIVARASQAPKQLGYDPSVSRAVKSYFE